jgi:hypothetical protein
MLLYPFESLLDVTHLGTLALDDNVPHRAL